MTAVSKRDMRATIRAAFQGAEARERESLALCRHLLESPLYKSAWVIGAYMPLPREADVTPVLQSALMDGKSLALPLCSEPPRMTLRKVSSMAELHKGAYGILEPAADTPVIPVDEVDLLLVPLEGVDRDGFRLGKGGGYYDCLLAQSDVMTIGCALSWQWVEKVPREPWDKPLRACADHEGIHYFMHDLFI